MEPGLVLMKLKMKRDPFVEQGRPDLIYLKRPFSRANPQLMQVEISFLI